jgi:hypothetical protein
MLSVDDILTSSGKYPDRVLSATQQVRINAQALVEKVNKLLTSFGKVRSVNSGFRTISANNQAEGSPTSWHLTGNAVDLEDKDGDLAVYCLCEQSLLEHFGLYLEDPRWTRKLKQPDGTWKHRWVHLQTKSPPSGRRVFRPAGPEPR